MPSWCRVLVALSLMTSCKRGSAADPPCAAVGAKFFALAKDALGSGAPAAPETRALHRAAAQQFPAMRDSIVALCTEGKWSADVRACLVAANDHLAFEACELRLTDEQRGALVRSTGAAPRRGESADNPSH